MSSRRIALVSEGDTDRIVIEAALSAVMPDSFVLISLQPESTLPRMGQGWGGVLRWCDQYSSAAVRQLSDHPLLSQFDAIILHIDADVTSAHYDQVGISRKASWAELPCRRSCPPPGDSVTAIEMVVLSWLAMDGLGHLGLFCVPSKNTDAWMVAALFGDRSRLVTGLECKDNPGGILAARPLRERVPKTRTAYRERAPIIASSWGGVCNICSQARRFSEAVAAIFTPA